MALINQNSIIGVTSITSPSSSNVLTVHANDTTERLRISETGLSFSGTNSSLDTSGNATFNGNVSIGGTLTYEDVTNIDSVGIITAQSGIHVTGGSVGIGTTNPDRLLHLSSNTNTRAKIATTNESSFGQLYLGDEEKFILGYRGSHPNEPHGISIKATNAAGYISLRTGGDNERLRITSDGSVGIGTTNPGDGSKLDIAQEFGRTRITKYGHIISQNTLASTTEYWTLAPRNGGQFEIGRGTPDGNGTIADTKFRITSAGVVQCGTSSTLKAEINNAVSGHQFISQCDDNNNGFEVYQQHGSNTTRNNLAVYANTGSSNAKYLQFSVRGDGNVGINTTTSDVSHRLTVNGTIATIKTVSASGGNAAEMLRFRIKNSANTSQESTLGGISGSTVSNWGGSLTFHTKEANGTPNDVLTERMRILNTGGITFNGDTATANALDDYEEGTLDWRLQRTGAIGSGSNHSDTSITYTKVGNRVYVSGYLYTQNTGGTTGVTVELRDNSNTNNVATLPYVPNQAGGFSITGTRTIDDNYRNMAVTFRHGQSQVYIYKDDGDNDYLKNKTNVLINSAQTHLVIQFCGSYTTDS